MSTTPTEPLRPLSDAELLATAQYLLAASLRVGDLVDYSPLIGESPRQLAIRIDAGPYGPSSHEGHWTVRLHGVGDVKLLAVRLNRRVEEDIIADAHLQLRAHGVPVHESLVSRIEWLARRDNDNIDLADAHKALTEAGAPTSDRGLVLTVGGRIRLMALELQQLRAAAERAVTIADEAFGIGPVEPIDSTLGRLERGIFDQHKRIVELETDILRQRFVSTTLPDNGGQSGSRQPGPRATQQGAATPGQGATAQGAVPAAGNVASLSGVCVDIGAVYPDELLPVAVRLLAASLREGDIVDYGQAIGKPPTRLGVRVAAAPVQISGDWMVQLDGVPGLVPVLAVTPSRRVPSLSGDYVEAKGEGIAAAFREFLCALGEGMNQLLPPGHERTRAAFHLEEAAMWAARAITSNWPGSAR